MEAEAYLNKETEDFNAVWANHKIEFAREEHLAEQASFLNKMVDC
jgi:hypothetical protein